MGTSSVAIATREQCCRQRGTSVALPGKRTDSDLAYVSWMVFRTIQKWSLQRDKQLIEQNTKQSLE